MNGRSTATRSLANHFDSVKREGLWIPFESSMVYLANQERIALEVRNVAAMGRCGDEI